MKTQKDRTNIKLAIPKFVVNHPSRKLMCTTTIIVETVFTWDDKMIQILTIGRRSKEAAAGA